jgi:hypothetical protein
MALATCQAPSLFARPRACASPHPITCTTVRPAACPSAEAHLAAHSGPRRHKGKGAAGAGACRKRGGHRHRGVQPRAHVACVGHKRGLKEAARERLQRCVGTRQPRVKHRKQRRPRGEALARPAAVPACAKHSAPCQGHPVDNVDSSCGFDPEHQLVLGEEKTLLYSQGNQSMLRHLHLYSTSASWGAWATSPAETLWP